MKPILILILAFSLLGVGAYFALDYQKQKAAGSAISPDMDFAVQNPEEIYRIFLADKSGKTALLERKEGRWIYNKTMEARQTAVELLLETMSKIRVNYVPPEAAEPTIIKSIAAEGIKVELYNKEGGKMKVYYVGGVTPDETGTYMMMEGADKPYVIHVPSMRGSVRVQYRLEEDEWMSRMVFEEKVDQIQSISVEYPQNKSESFKLDKVEEGNYQVTPFYSTTPVSKTPQKKGSAEAYLITFEKLGAEAVEKRNLEKDSIMNMVPFAIITLKNTQGFEKKVEFWPVDQLEEQGRLYNIRYLAQCSWGPLMLVQHHVFGPAFRGYSMFFNKSVNQ